MKNKVSCSLIELNKKIQSLEEENQKLKTKILGLEGENKELTEQNTQLLVKLKESK